VSLNFGTKGQLNTGAGVHSLNLRKEVLEMALLSTNPFESLLRLQKDLDRALGSPNLGINGGSNVFPPLNIFSNKDGMVIRAEVPGFKSDQIDLRIEPRTLTLEGHRAPDEHRRPGSYHRLERQYGNFARSLQLPPGLDTEKATAECRHGLLTIRIPKAESAKPKQIKVKAAA
jgi:HSP20 family protein